MGISGKDKRFRFIGAGTARHQRAERRVQTLDRDAEAAGSAFVHFNQENHVELRAATFGDSLGLSEDPVSIVDDRRVDAMGEQMTPERW